MMKFDGLEDMEMETRNVSKKLVQLRRNNIQFTYGGFEILQVKDQTFVYARKYFDKTGIVVFNKSKEEKNINILVPQHYNLKNLNNNFMGEIATENYNISIKLKANSFDVLTN